MNRYRIVDLATGVETNVEAASPERAGTQVMGCELVRSGPPRQLTAKAYFQFDGQPMSMVRLYQRVAEARQSA